MKRRDFLTHAGAGSLIAGSALSVSKLAKAEPKYKWKMVTTWPKNFPGLGTGANLLAKLITEMSGGRIEVKVYGAKELVPAFEVFNAVSSGNAEMGHGASYYWKGKSEAAQFFAAVPFGLNAQEMNSWLYYGGGMELWKEIYAEFNLIPAAAGNTGVQMGGWFNREIKSINDLKGLKMRIPGLGGEVLKRAGGTPVSLPGGEIYTSLQSGAIDATEWVGPYNDLAFGFSGSTKPPSFTTIPVSTSPVPPWRRSSTRRRSRPCPRICKASCSMPARSPTRTCWRNIPRATTTPCKPSSTRTRSI